MTNGAAALTDECDYLQKYFNDGSDIIFYHRNKMEDLSQIAENIYANPEKLADIAWKGYQKALEEHTWHKSVENLMKHISHQDTSL